MMATLAFVPAVPRQRFATTLEGRTFVFDCHWNERAEAWYLDILDAEENPIRMGLKIVLGTYIGGRSVSPDMPDGVIVARDLSGQGKEATFDDLGVRVVVGFLPYEEAA